jgi:hypothetical protein
VRLRHEDDAVGTTTYADLIIALEDGLTRRASIHP